MNSAIYELQAALDILISTEDGTTSMTEAYRSAYNISDTFRKANGSLSQAWLRVGTLCGSVSDGLRDKLSELKVVVDQFVEQTIENEKQYYPSFEKTSNEVERIIKEFNLPDGLG